MSASSFRADVVHSAQCSADFFKENLSNIEKMLHMLKESILVEDFNLHHFT